MLCLLVSLRFQVLFHSPPGVLFTFPSRYYSLSVTWSYLAFWDGPHFFRQDFSCPDVLRITLARLRFRLRGFHPLCLTFPDNSTTFPDAISRSLPRIYYYIRFGLLRFRSPLLSESLFCFLFLRVLRCFSSPGSPPLPMDSVTDYTILLVQSSLIRISADHRIFAPPRSFSQLVTSFFGAMYQGILRKLFVAWSVFSSFLQKFYFFYSANLFLAALQTVKIVLRYFCINLLALLFFLNMKNFAFRTRLSPFFQKLINFSLAMQLWIFGFPFRQKGASS